MTDPKDSSKDERGGLYLLRRFWVYVRDHRRWLLLGLLMIPVVAGMTVVRPLLLKHAVDVDIPARDVHTLRVTALLFLLAVVLEFISQAVQVYALQRVGHVTINDLRRAVFRHVLRLPARFFDKNPLGALLARSTTDIEALSETLAFGVFTILTDVVMILVVLGAMFYLDARLTLISLAVAPLIWILVRVFSARLRALQLEVRKAQAVQGGYLTEQLAGATVLQLFGRQRAAVAEFERLGGRYLRTTKTANIYDALLFSLIDGISALCIALLIYFGAPGVVDGSGLTLGLLFAFIDYLQRVFVPIREFSGKLATVQRALAALDRVYGLLDEPAEPRLPEGAPDPLHTWTGGLRVRGLRFRYRQDGPEILKGIDLDVAPGEVVAVVGRTGSGKTSLGRVLTRAYDGYQGSVQLTCPDGQTHELSTLSPDALRRHALLVQQDIFLFAEDVAFNVALGEPELSGDPEALRAALRAVQAEALVDERGGLEFQVGERGRALSAGEAQLLAFARVAARAPTFLILDEATASVDSVTEHKVQRAIEALLRGRSVLVIAHRLSTVRRADKILVMDAGQIIEQGTHDQLLARGGAYAQLYRMGLDAA
ncbi:MAG: ABC transporter ATP-binding protein [Nannocystis sp.]|nr:ABC transporter ATP-binding protein [Nannocystis sp.]